MTRQSVGVFAVTIICAGAGAPSRAQTNDHVFRSWAWSNEVGSPRAAGLGGADVALTDDSASIAGNPAALATLTKTEFAGAGQRWGSGDIGGRDALSSRVGVAFVGGAGRLSGRWALGGYVAQPHSVRLRLAETPLPDGSRDTGALEATVTDAGGAVGFRLAGRLFVGARVTATHLKLESDYTQRSGSGSLRIASAAGSTRVVAAFGILFAGERLRVGIVGNPGASYPVDRRSSSGVGDGVYDLRAPARYSGGLAWRVSDRLLVTAQVDWVRYGEIRDQFAVRQAALPRADYVLEDAVEPRAGVEISIPMRSWSLQLRAGVHSQGGGSLRYGGPDRTEAAAFNGTERQVRGSAGVSIASASGLILDAAGVVGPDRTSLLAGAKLRF